MMFDNFKIKQTNYGRGVKGSLHYRILVLLLFELDNLL